MANKAPTKHGAQEAVGDFDLNDLVEEPITLKDDVPIPELKRAAVAQPSLAKLAMDWRQLKVGDKVKLTMQGNVLRVDGDKKARPYPSLTIKTAIGIKVFYPDDDPMGIIVTEAVNRA